ncbi:hypothetical protein [Sphingomonas sp. Leaf257]|jgi:hypothetical protein|uniref:hypothetical protein n=1 Tax=Sphingomonas sp. Leaf257 TaxID=1736309 RepID=UPI00070173BE|nr:hypothetical protein [Sphingomonas sp. Leaf257]KQO49786.1 hypothetical protein ASF14_13160 [Sphingomonas sp. Leaf257]
MNDIGPATYNVAQFYHSEILLGIFFLLAVSQFLEALGQWRADKEKRKAKASMAGTSLTAWGKLLKLAGFGTLFLALLKAKYG